jgi:hypothetical protein
MSKIVAKRVHAGVYTYTLGEDVVRVEDREPNPAFGDTKTMWMAIALWDDKTFSDPMDSKWQAVETAHHWLRERAAKLDIA